MNVVLSNFITFYLKTLSEKKQQQQQQIGTVTHNLGEGLKQIPDTAFWGLCS